MRRKVAAVLAIAGLACSSGRGAGAVVWATPFTPAHNYRASGPGDSALLSGAANPALRAVLESGARAHGRELQGDGRLAQIAQFLVDRPDPGAPAPPRLVELAARQLGVFDPQLEAAVLTLSGDGRADIDGLLSEKLDAGSFTHYGAAIAPRGGKRWLGVLFTQRTLNLEPLPRSLPVGAPIVLRGRLPPDFERARADLLAEGGGRALLPLGAGPEFDLQLPTPRAGLYRVEIVADGALGATVLAKLAIYVGVAPSSALELPRAEPVFEPAALRALLFERINHERQRASLPLLAADARLDALAQRHTLDMSDHGFVSHTSPRSGDARQRVSRAGLEAGLVLETIARAPDAQALAASATDPGGEGRNLWTREVTHLGIGLASMPDAHGPTLIATALFAQLPELPDPVLAKPRLLSLVNGARVQRGSSAIALDAGLCELAERAVRRFVGEPALSEQNVVEVTERELGKFSLAYRRVSALLTVSPRLEDAASLEPVLDPQAGGLGIGIAAGQRPDRGSILAIMMLVGVRRNASSPVD